MNSAGSPRRTLALAVFSFGLGATLAAQTPALDAAPAGGRVEPGATLTASWPAGLAGPERRDEMELVLSLDGGRTFPVRLTGRIPAGARSATWRVPALPSGSARLALRAGREEEEASEEVVAVSEPFEIEAPRGPPSGETLYPVGHEWRTREALEGLPALPPGGELGNDEDSRIAPNDADDTGAETPPSATPVIRVETGREFTLDSPSRFPVRTVRFERTAPLPLRL